MRKHLIIIHSIFYLLQINICQSQQISKPNFVFLLADDLGWRDLGCYGSNFYETPNLDALALEGMKFTQAYAASPVCSPTRASIMTGKYPARTATTDWFGAPQPDNVQGHWTRDKPLLPAPYKDYLALEEKNLAEALREAGYATFFAGKWHLGPEEKYWPENQGFDINIGGHKAGGPWGGSKYFSPYENPKMENGPDGEYLPLRLADETAKFIEEHQDTPFFAYLSFYSVHTPLMTTEELEKKYQQKKEQMGLEDNWGVEGDNKVRLVQCHPVYAGMVEAMDKAVGIVMDKLKALGLEDNTIIIFMSDNGGLSTAEGHPTSNLPLRAGKGWLYEGGIREPLIIKWPGQTKAGGISDEPIISNDFYPTILEMAGLPLLPQQHQDGKSLVKLLKGNSQLSRDALYWHYPHYGNQGGSPGAAIRQDDWKLIWWFEDDRLELFNIKNDIGENQDLAEQQPKRVRELKQNLDSWLESVEARMPSSNTFSQTR